MTICERRAICCLCAAAVGGCEEEREKVQGTHKCARLVERNININIITIIISFGQLEQQVHLLLHLHLLVSRAIILEQRQITESGIVVLERERDVT